MQRLLAVWVIATSALALGCGESRSKPSHGRTARTLPGAPVTQGGGVLVGVGGGRRLLMNCVGAGRPTIVLVAGFGAGAFAWRDVQPRLARMTRVCAYDRAGTGSSDPAPGVRDARAEVADLRRLLDRVGADPPYVLVGHSYGGVVARVFGYLRPAETAGLVLIDTMGRDGRRRQLAIWPRSQAPSIRHQLATSRMHGVALARGEALAGRISTLGDMPLAVITAGRQDAFPQSPARLHRVLVRLWDRMQDELAGLSDNHLHVIALGSNHDVPSAQTGEPSVVTRAVEAVVDAQRGHSRLPPCRDVFMNANVRCRS